MAVPEVFEKHYENQVLFLLLKTIYGLNIAAKAFCKELLKAFGSDADPCMYYKWDAAGLLVWLSWIDDCGGVVKKE